MTETIEGLSIGLDLNTIRVETGLKDLRSKMSLVNSEMKANLSAFDRGDKSIGKYETRLQGLNKKLEVQKEITNKAHKSYEKMVAQHGEGSNEADKAARAYNEESAKLNNLSRYVGEATTELQRMQEQQQLTTSGWGKMSQQFEETGSKLKQTGDKMKGVGKTMSLYVTAPLAAMGGLAIKTGIDFDDSMAKVAATSSATGEDLSKLREKAKQMGATTKFSASDASEAMNYMAMAGWKTADMLEGLDGVMNLAAASGEDLGMVSDIVTDGLTAFGLQAKDSGRFADVLAAASSNANTNVAMLGKSFEYAAPVAGALGYSIEDTSLALGLMANAGIKADKGGTALRTMLTNLVTPTQRMATIMEKLGVSLTDGDGKMKDLRTIMDDLRGSFKGLTEDEQASYAAMLFGKEAMSGALAVINASEKDYNKLAKAVDNSTGSAKKMSDIMEGEVGGTIREIKSGIEGLAISFYETMLPVLKFVASAINKTVQVLNKMPDSMRLVVTIVAALAAAIGPVVFVIGSFVSILGSAMTALAPVMLSIAQAGGLLAVLKGAFLALTGPVGITIGIIAALTTAFTIAYKKSETFRNIMQAVGRAIKSAFSSLMNASKQILSVVVGVFEVLGLALKRVYQGFMWIVKGVKNLLMSSPLVQAYVEQLKKNFDFMVGYVKIVINTIKGYFSAFISYFKSIIDGWKAILNGDFKQGLNIMITTVKDLFKNLKSVFLSGFNKLGEILKTWLSEPIKKIRGMASKVKDSFSSWGSAIGSWFKDTGVHIAIWTGEWIASILNWFKGMPSKIKEQFVIWKNDIGDWFEKQKERIIEKLGGWSEAIIGWFQSLPSKILDSLESWKNAINSWTEKQNEENKRQFGEWLTTIVEWFKSVPGKMKEGFKDWKDTVGERFTNIKDTIEDKLNGWGGTITNWFKGIPGKIKEGFVNWKSTISERFENIKTKIKDKLSGWGTAITDFFKDIPGKTKEGFGNLKTGVSEGFTNAKQSITDGLSNWWTEIKSWFQGVPNKPEVKDAGKNIVKKVTAGTTDPKEKKDFTEKLGKLILGVIGAALAFVAVALFSAGRELIKLIIKGMQAGDAFLNKQMDKLKKVIVDKFNEAKDAAFQKVKDMMAKVVAKISDMKKSISDVMTKVKTAISDAWSKIYNGTKNNVQKVYTTARDRFIAVRDAVSGAIKTTKDRVSNTWGAIKKKTSEVFKAVYDSIKKRFNDIVQAAKDLPGRIGAGISKMASKVGNGIGDLKDTMLGKLKDALNGVIGGINWVLNLLNLDGIDPWNGKSKGKAKLEKHAHGTGTKGHGGGLAMINDGRGANAGPELLQFPNGEHFMAKGKDVITPLPKGTHVWSAPETRNILSGVPAYKNGTKKKKKSPGRDLSALEQFGSGKFQEHEMKKKADKTAKKAIKDVWSMTGKAALNLGLKTLGIKKPDGDSFAGKLARAGWDKIMPGATSFIEKERDAAIPLSQGISFGKGFIRTSGFGPRWGKHHAGLDFAAAMGSKIRAQAAGTVAFSGFGKRGNGFTGYGNTVFIKGGGGYSYLYGHNSKNLVKTGDAVSKGDIIGLVGSTGDSTGPHVHFEVRKDGKAINPDLMTGGGASGGAKAWSPQIKRAAMQMNENISLRELNGVVAQIHRESRGNQSVVQSPLVRDINTLNGNPAKGLLQYIPQTFRKYAMKGHSNIFNGYDQLLAFFNNTKWRSDLPYGRRGWGPTGSRKFGTGGLIKASGLYNLAEDGFPEWVIPTDPARRTDAMKLLALAGRDLESKNKRPHQLPNITGQNNNTNDNSYLQKTVELLTEQVMLLQQLVVKDNDLIMDGRSVAAVTYPHIQQLSDKERKKAERGRG